MLFGNVNIWDRHHSTEPHRLLRDDELIEATWSSFHRAYVCKTINTITNEEDSVLLTDADLKRAEMVYEA